MRKAKNKRTGNLFILSGNFIYVAIITFGFMEETE